MRAGACVDAHPFAGSWLDVGSLAAYLDANLSWLEGRGLASFVGSGADVRGATFARSIVGVKATIAPGAHLESCVVWPSAQVPAGAHRRTIFAPGLPPLTLEPAAGEP
jgi:ADP-glucose pyrophosphorylase